MNEAQKADKVRKALNQLDNEVYDGTLKLAPDRKKRVHEAVDMSLRIGDKSLALLYDILTKED